MKRYIILFATLFAVIFSATAQRAEFTTGEEFNSNKGKDWTIDDGTATKDLAENTQEPVADNEQVESPVVDLNTVWSSANAAYNESNYSKAVELYEAILADGQHSAELYYNLGNAYYKQEMLGKAIVNYNRALRLAPADEDILHNLEYATQATKDNIEEIPTFFLITWVRALRNIMGSNAWTIISLLTLALTLLAALVYLLAERLSLRKTGFYSMCLVALISIISTTFAYQTHQALTNSNEAVIMSSAVPVKSSPDRAATDLFVVHEGTKLSLGERIDGWVEIRIADGRKGWIETSRIEII